MKSFRAEIVEIGYPGKAGTQAEYGRIRLTRASATEDLVVLLAQHEARRPARKYKARVQELGR